MTHIISKKHGFSFIHIPKNGGSTLWEGLADLDDTGKVFTPGIIEHEELGRVWLGHMPLWAIERHYPSLYEVVRGGWAFSITRDPYTRFASALAQRGRMFLDLDVVMLSPKQLHAEADKVKRALEATDAIVPPEFCHFIRQTDFVHDGAGAKIVDTYPIEHFSYLLADIDAKVGVRVRDEQANATTVPRFGGIGRWALITWSAIKPRLPAGLQDLLRSTLGEMMTSTGSDESFRFVHQAPTRDFIEQYYRDDFELYEQSKQGASKQVEPASAGP